jgi:ABC-type transporter Mla subunit MlaD
MNASEILSIQTGITEMVTAATAEASAWQAMIGRAAQLAERVQTIETTIDALEAKLGPVRNVDADMLEQAAASLIKIDPDAVVTRLHTYLERIASAVASSGDLASELDESGAFGAIFAAVESAAAETINAIDEAAGDLRASFDTLTESLTGDVEEVLSETSAELDEQLGELRSTLEEQMQAAMQETFESALDGIAATTAETIESSMETITGLSEDLGNVTKQVEQEVNRCVERWSATGQAVVDSYEELRQSLEGLGRDIDTLRDATASAMEAGGVRMNAASRTLEDMMDVMGSVS